MRSFFFASILIPLSVLAVPVLRRDDKSTLLALQFAHVLEQLETAFYQQALAKFQPSDFTNAGFNSADIPVQQFMTIRGDEASHTTALEGAITSLGGTPISSCQFDFTSALTNVKTMAAVARLVENVGVSAYLGAASLITSPQLLSVAASILTIEARHQSILNVLNRGSSIAAAFDMALSPSQVLAMAGPFISGSNPVLTVTSNGTVGPGTKLTFSSPAIDNSPLTTNLTCQMMLGGAPMAIALPFDQCIVPNGINGLVYLYITNTSQPLLQDLTHQFSGSIVAGPTGAFIDTQPEALSEALFNNSTAGSGAGETTIPSTPGPISTPSAPPTNTDIPTSSGSGTSSTPTITSAPSPAPSIPSDAGNGILPFTTSTLLSPDQASSLMMSLMSSTSTDSS
ncbi:uncharacterized protein EI90DRAFT_3118017 [Cantharellus anzutake]|uniref:uncharacterized protein n=1 Tax=Cantharellus anzutake TaxID=1750568 RepID=UPI0019062B4F|nr:uncharacterized protein EI90DRAFT_3118017 [Cantharellus anzutake]KAF8338946.1 hypothetical protein EI90DRAFT_3118017 [Cantharellus anzutake]